MPIVEGTGTASVSRMPAGRGLAKRIEEAMAAAVMQANQEGITDAVEVRARMMEARDAAKAAFEAEVAE